MPIGAPMALVVAFDGFIALTGPARASALASGLERHGLFTGTAEFDAAVTRLPGGGLAGHTFAEAARALLRELAAVGDAAGADETLVDLISLEASRKYARLLADGVQVAPEALTFVLRETARSRRVVARADSARAEVNVVLEMGGLASAFSFVRCSDDAPRVTGHASVLDAWHAIDRRLQSSGISPAQRDAVELTPYTHDVARPFVAHMRPPTFTA